jgi:hypothetical protein
MVFNWKGMAFDYAFVPFGDLGSNNILSVGMKF